MVLKNKQWIISFAETGNKRENHTFELIYDSDVSVISGNCTGKDPNIRDRVALSILSKE
jgi:hypothetical protein